MKYIVIKQTWVFLELDKRVKMYSMKVSYEDCGFRVMQNLIGLELYSRN